jgi:hypothetical protein
MVSVPPYCGTPSLSHHLPVVDGPVVTPVGGVVVTLVVAVVVVVVVVVCCAVCVVVVADVELPQEDRRTAETIKPLNTEMITLFFILLLVYFSTGLHF